MSLSLNPPSVGIFSVHGWFVFAKKWWKNKCNDCKTEKKHREKLMKTRPRPYLTWPSFPLTHTYTDTLKSSLFDHPKHFSDHFYLSSRVCSFLFQSFTHSVSPRSDCGSSNEETSGSAASVPSFMLRCWFQCSSHSSSWLHPSSTAGDETWPRMKAVKPAASTDSHTFTQCVYTDTFYVIIMQLKEWKVTFIIHQCE